MAVLYIFSGLSGAGKSTLAQGLAKRVGAAYVRIDTIEQALRDLYRKDVVGEGYALAWRIVADNLRMGLSVVADSCNPIEITRTEWEKVAAQAEAKHVNIEVICSDKIEHRRRAEGRPGTVPGLRLPTWQEVEQREYEPWSRERMVLETAGKTEGECLAELCAALDATENC